MVSYLRPSTLQNPKHFRPFYSKWALPIAHLCHLCAPENAGSWSHPECLNQNLHFIKIPGDLYVLLRWVALLCMVVVTDPFHRSRSLSTSHTISCLSLNTSLWLGDCTCSSHVVNASDHTLVSNKNVMVGPWTCKTLILPHGRKTQLCSGYYF